MKSLIGRVCLLAVLCGTTAQAQFNALSSSLTSSARSAVESALLTCGFQKIPGDDKRLSGAVRARRVEDVFMALNRYGNVVPYVLVGRETTREARGDTNGSSALKFSKANGGFLLSFEDDYQSYDLTVSLHGRGAIAQTVNYRRNGEYLTDYRIRPQGHGTQKVTESAFESYIFDTVVVDFAKEICSQRH